MDTYYPESVLLSVGKLTFAEKILDNCKNYWLELSNVALSIQIFWDREFWDL